MEESNTWVGLWILGWAKSGVVEGSASVVVLSTSYRLITDSTPKPQFTP